MKNVTEVREKERNQKVRYSIKYSLLLILFEYTNEVMENRTSVVTH